MIIENYVSFETAKLLKEKGYCNISNTLYNENGEFIRYDVGMSNNGYSCILGEFYECPTIQMAMKWLREVHNIHIDICSNWDIIHWIYQVFVITPRTARNSYVDKILYTSYEKAVEAGIKYALENLI